MDCCDPIINHALILSKEKLYNHLGPDKAAFATPMMLEGGEIEWYSFLEDDKGQKGMQIACTEHTELSIMNSRFL